MIEMIIGVLVGALAMLTWLALASYIYDQFTKEINR